MTLVPSPDHHTASPDDHTPSPHNRTPSPRDRSGRRGLRRPLVGLAVAAVLGAGVLAGCTDNTPGALTVSAGDDSCTVSAASAPSGRIVFSVTNSGSKINEFYVLGSDGLRILGEVENIGPGLSRELVVQAAPGEYLTACKPGMVGAGIRSEFTVTDSGADLTPVDEDKKLVDTANAEYASYVRDQTEQLLEKTRQFVTLYKAGSDAKARALYPDARVHWERIEPVAETFGDLDPRMDLREADLEKGQTWTGWHLIEKDLWPPHSGYTSLSTAQRARFADQLLKDTTTLYNRTRTMTFTATDTANGARGLLDEVAKSKLTGEEESWSHTDLWDFQANVDGARVAFEGLEPLLETKNPTLSQQISSRFAQLQALLDEHRRGSGFLLYGNLSRTDIKHLSDSVNALSEPLSQLAGAVTS